MAVQWRSTAAAVAGGGGAGAASLAEPAERHQPMRTSQAAVSCAWGRVRVYLSPGLNYSSLDGL
jgi:hypothetical protein